MGENSAIQWTDHTLNGWLGCEEVDPDPEHSGGPSECDNCYARRGSARIAARYRLKLWPDAPGGPSDRFFTSETYMRKILTWDRKAAAEGVRRRVFAFSYGDIFEDRADLVTRRNQYLDLVKSTPHLDHLMLTKRPENMIRLASPVFPAGWPSNVWAGTTVGLRPSLARVDHLRKVPAAVRFLSMEPLIEDVPLDGLFGLKEGNDWQDCVCEEIDPIDRPCLTCDGRRLLGERSGIHWVIVGGESGSKARPFRLQWARRLRDSCKAAGVAFFFKQLGSVPLIDLPTDLGGRRMKWWQSPTTLERRMALDLKDSHGGDWEEWPADLRVREFPRAVVGNGADRYQAVSS